VLIYMVYNEFFTRGQVMTYDTLESVMNFQASDDRSSIGRPREIGETMGQRFLLEYSRSVTQKIDL